MAYQNKIKYREAMKKNYINNKQKWYSRQITGRMIKWKYLILPENCCKECGKKDDLEIHHEIYPTRMKDLKEAIKSEKIYLLCKKCHRKRSKRIKKQDRKL